MKNSGSQALPPVALRVFETLPMCCVVLSPQLMILTVSDNHVKIIGKRRCDITDRYFFDVFPVLAPGDEGDDSGLAASFRRVLATKEQQQIQLLRFDVPDPEHPDKLKEAYWQTIDQPVLGDDGEIAYIIHKMRDISQQVFNERNMRERLERERQAKIAAEQQSQQLDVLFHSVPAQIAVISGDDLVYTYINPQYKKELFPDRDVLGLPLLTAIPEIADKPIWQTLKRVYTTGEPFIHTEMQVSLASITGGELNDHYFNVVYQPLRDESGNVNAILSFKYEVTGHVAARKMLEVKEQKLLQLNADLQQAYEDLQASNEELMAGNEELSATNDALTDAQEALALLNATLEERISKRTADLRESESEQQKLNEELTAINEEMGATNEELAATNEELIESQHRLEELVNELATSEQKVRSLVESAPFPIGVYVGPEMRIELLNQAIIEAWNRGNDLIGRTYAEVLPELAGTGVYEHLSRVYTTGQPYHAQNERVDLMVDGQLKPFYFNYDFTPLFNGRGEVYGVMNTAADVTELVHAKLHVEQSEKSLYNIVMRSPVAKCILLGADHTVSVANDRIIALWGKSRESIMNRPIFEGLPEATGQGLEELLHEVYTTGKTFEAFERPVTLLRNNEPETLYLNFVYQPYRDAQENVVGVMATAVDVTSHVKARDEVQQLNEELAATNEELQSASEEQAAINEKLGALNDALKISQDELQLAIDAGGLATWDYSPRSGKFSGNELTKSWFGLQPEDEIDLHKATSIIIDADRERVITAINQALTFESGGDYQIDYTICNPLTNVLREVRAKGRALFDDSQQPTRLSGVLQDVTEQKKDEQRKNDFIGIVSHELKTPLTSIKALLQVAAMKLKTSDDTFLRGAVEKSNIQVKKMETMISGFLNVSRLESGKMQIDKSEFNLQELLDDTIKEMQLTLSSHQIKFLPYAPIGILADYDKVSLVISNLLSNAIKYSPKGGRIDVCCEIVGNSVQVSVKDEGYGINAEDKEKLFERYYRVETSYTRHISGFGIGLYLCAEIIARHHGRIWVESTEGEGSTFFFNLPL